MMHFTSILLTMLLTTNTAWAEGPDNANDRVTESSNVSRGFRLLRGDNMPGDGGSSGFHTRVKVSPSAHKGEPIESITNNEWPAPVMEADESDGDHGKAHRHLQGGGCSIFAEGIYVDLPPGWCYDLGGTWWNDRITHFRASSNTCIELFEHESGGDSVYYCGSDDWADLDGTFSRQASRACCS